MWNKITSLQQALFTSKENWFVVFFVLLVCRQKRFKKESTNWKWWTHYLRILPRWTLPRNFKTFLGLQCQLNGIVSVTSEELARFLLLWCKKESLWTSASWALNGKKVKSKRYGWYYMPAALIREISIWTREGKIHIHARACNILYISNEYVIFCLLYTHQWNTKSACFQRRVYYVTITTVISSREKIWSWYFTGVYIINTPLSPVNNACVAASNV